MRIGDLARSAGISTRLLRYYEEQGLITPERAGNGYRVYPESAVAEVARIRRLLAAGLPVRVIRDVLACVCGSDEDVEPCMAPALRAELLDLDRRADEILDQRAALRELVARVSTADRVASGNAVTATA
ncbi:MerR family transcriptional regulator [Actinophytocola xanthii]|uniref:HTH merR-type domain-containing protein n=1 Tax=Actinophytocola xanthii TaxID=1912961 RepID=A0A1Q8CKV4_9PSEU|nr:MerR family transcriptional regulator [Actinophytocola xanthii]OLF14990.1 hypothetical protein BU204_24090 [Actinophytocola xanthii]